MMMKPLGLCMAQSMDQAANVVKLGGTPGWNWLGLRGKSRVALSPDPWDLRLWAFVLTGWTGRLWVPTYLSEMIALDRSHMRRTESH